MRKVPPIAPVAAKGPLGVVQMPRLWSKMLLDAKGLLPEGYFPCGHGFDRVLIEGLGLDRERVVHYLSTELPTYAQFEAWVRSELGGSVNAEKIEAVNETILGRDSAPERRRDLLLGAGFPEDLPITKGAEVNQLDDWAEFHRCLKEV